MNDMNDIIDIIVSTGCVPLDIQKHFTHEEIMEIENKASASSDNKLRKFIEKILKRK